MEAKSKDSNQRMDEIAEKLRKMNVFATNQDFEDYKKEVDEKLAEAMKVKESLNNYIDTHKFKDFVDNTTTEL